MQNPSHTLVIDWDAQGNVEYRDLTSGAEGHVPAKDELLVKGEGGRRILIYHEPDAEVHEGLP